MTGVDLRRLIAGVLWGLVTVAFGISEPSAEEPAPPLIEASDGAVFLTSEHMPPRDIGQRSLVRVAFPHRTGPVLGPEQAGPGQQVLRRLFAAGQAAGNAGDLYENRDRGHSSLSLAAHPQLRELHKPFGLMELRDVLADVLGPEPRVEAQARPPIAKAR